MYVMEYQKSHIRIALNRQNNEMEEENEMIEKETPKEQINQKQ